jgi:hypothetical protein
LAVLSESGEENLTMTKKKDGNQFDDLSMAVEGSAEDIPQSTEKKQAKGNNPDYVRSTFYLSKQVHRQLKKAAVDEEKEMSEIVEELVTQWLKSRKSDV